MIHHKLQELRRRFGALQQLARNDSGQLTELLPRALTSVQQSIEELQSIIDELPLGETIGAFAPLRRDPGGALVMNPRSGTQLRSIAERSRVFVRIMRNATSCRWTNGAWLEATGQTLENTLGTRWLLNVHVDDRERCTESARTAFESGEIYSVEYRLLRASGEHGAVLELGVPLRTSRGQVGGYLVAAMEVSGYEQSAVLLTLQYAVARVLARADTLAEAAPSISQLVCESLGWDAGEVWSVDAHDGEPRRVQLWIDPSLADGRLRSDMHATSAPDSTLPPADGALTWVADMADDAVLARTPETQRAGLHALLHVPIEVHGEIGAYLRVFSLRPRPRDEAQVSFMTCVGIQIGQFLERQRDAERVRAFRDPRPEATLDAVITIDVTGCVVEFTPAAEILFGFRRESVIGRELVELMVPARLRERARASFAGWLAAGSNGGRSQRFASFAQRLDGTEFPVEVTGASLGGGDPPLLTLHVCDTTASKRSENDIRQYQDRLRAMMAELLLAEERERRRLAVDLHDGLSQTIALAQMKLSALRVAMDGKLARSLDEIEALIDQTNRTARSISFELSPPVLHDFGLEPAVQWLVENIQTRYGIEIRLDDDGQPKPADEKTRVILFRSIRELLINAAKHARASRVHVSLRRDAGQLAASVEDDGVGMEPDVAAVSGSGLFSIHERLSHVGGSMRIESAPGRGTKVRLCAPLAQSGSPRTRVEA